MSKPEDGLKASAAGSPESEAPGAAAEKRADEVLQKHDTSSRFRKNLGWWAWVVGGLSAAFTIWHLYYAFERPILMWRHMAIHVAGATALIFMLYPASRKLLDLPSTGDKVKDFLIGRGPGIAWYDVALAAGSLYCSLYIVFRYEYLLHDSRVYLGYDTLSTYTALFGVLLVLEATRRCVGLPIVIIAGVALFYGVTYWGSIETMAERMFLRTGGGIWNTPIRVSSDFIFLFLLFATVLIRTNIGQFFNDVAFRLAGRFTGGPAKAAVGASGLQGMVSGSSVANTVASGSFTIPIMKNSGFKPHVAAATEATASTGGQLMPPIMGAAAFIMAQNIGVDYNDLIVMAFIPAILYFVGCFLSVHYYAKRNQLKGMPVEDLPSWKSLLVRIDLLLPLIIIVGTLLAGMTPTRAALLGVGTAFALSFIRASTRLGPRGILDLFISGARNALPVIAACASAGLVAGTISATGLAGNLGGIILGFVRFFPVGEIGEFLIVLVLVMVLCIILGMGLPTTANYVVTATIAAPILINNYDVEPVAAHLFVFFFGILADITPPVCLAAYAGAGIANANPMMAGVAAVRIAFAAFLIPYVFILQPALVLQGEGTQLAWDLSTALITVLIGMIAMASGLAGHLYYRASALERTLLLVGGILLIYPEVLVSAVGLVIMGLAVASQLMTRRGYDTDEPQEEDAEESTEQQPAS